ncbi:MAG: hypothetical protein K8I02_08810 [Candidatus Methylomirabilis sp.]|nr:hypothetical protein [Deltaproteobacteria bacterium]
MGFEEQIVLPHTDLRVGRVGLGSSFGVDADDMEEAFDHGVNFFYWGSIRRPRFGKGIRRLARRDRSKIVVALQSYARAPGLMTLAVETGLLRLGLDYADVLIFGWHNFRPFGFLLDEARRLKERGRVRRFLMSGHNRPFFPEMAEEDFFDLFMVRYNAVHRGAEKEIFPLLPPGPKRPGIVAYTATRWGNLMNPKKTPPGERTPRASDCYRFCLTNPEVNMVLSGPANREETREAIETLKRGPMSEDELAWMRRVGDHIHKHARMGA